MVWDRRVQLVRTRSLEQIVRLGDVLEGGVEAGRASRPRRAPVCALLAETVAGADAVAVAQLPVHWRDYVALGDDDGLAGHRRCLVRGGARLHNLLEVRGQVDERASCRQLRLIRVDLKLDVSDAPLREAGVLALGADILRRAQPARVVVLVRARTRLAGGGLAADCASSDLRLRDVPLHDLFPLAHLLVELVISCGLGGQTALKSVLRSGPHV